MLGFEFASGSYYYLLTQRSYDNNGNQKTLDIYNYDYYDEDHQHSDYFYKADKLDKVITTYRYSYEMYFRQNRTEVQQYTYGNNETIIDITATNDGEPVPMLYNKIIEKNIVLHGKTYKARIKLLDGRLQSDKDDTSANKLFSSTLEEYDTRGRIIHKGYLFGNDCSWPCSEDDMWVHINTDFEYVSDEVDRLKKVHTVEKNWDTEHNIDTYYYYNGTKMIKQKKYDNDKLISETDYYYKDVKVSGIEIEESKVYLTDELKKLGINSDNDQDGMDDIFDTDDDNDGISDSDEIKYGLNPKDASDADKDNDGDGYSNKDEILHDTDPNDPDSKICTQVVTHAYNPKTGDEKDFSTPCNVPKDWTIGKAPDFDSDGINDIKDPDDDNDGISDADEIKYGLNPKDASDANQDRDGDGVSNIDEINNGTNPTDKNSIPEKYLTSIYFGKDIKITPQEDANVTLIAERELLSYPKNVKIAIDYNKTTIDAGDINITDGYNFKFENNTTISHTVVFNNNATCSDDLSSNVTFKIDKLDSGLAHTSDEQTIYLVCRKDLQVNVKFMQNGKSVAVISDTSTPLIVKLELSSLDSNASFDISNSNSELLAHEIEYRGIGFAFNLSDMEDGSYNLVINAKKGNVELILKRTIVIKSDKETAEQDSDGDGIADSYDNVKEHNKIQTQLKGGSFLIEVRVGERIALGNVALKLGEQKAAIDVSKVKGIKGYKIKEIFDFRVSNLEKGESTYVVLPLMEPISQKQQFVKYDENGTIQDFKIDDKNKIYTAKSQSQGVCPIPASTIYKEGLNAGDDCIELLIEDGGANDQDNLVNGEVLDPNAIVEKEEKKDDNDSGNDNNGGNNNNNNDGNDNNDNGDDPSSDETAPTKNTPGGAMGYGLIALLLLLMLIRREDVQKAR